MARLRAATSSPLAAPSITVNPSSRIRSACDLMAASVGILISPPAPFPRLQEAYRAEVGLGSNSGLQPSSGLARLPEIHHPLGGGGHQPREIDPRAFDVGRRR